ncbi:MULTISPECIES: protease modulator HflC [Paraburkholderia]|uniref:Protein HflC n=1 Tax=Paraburkholderia megapolitana TaxID=420953 RepID=A0A1I3NHL1_9BURK|nr:MULTISPECIES: protease modulator HflC [Paraburkholderia]MCX4162160.1 protease modulator HflC [Paraburkholderia megapolitana]MDN7157655.1 protease modulator HflC [Paraburkholderia sp. CHISQ3]MDQ6494702.1 protease modulator HflC [Paraburkholderia megapolitana]QDQ84379.1 protease modulator HflC [Paraburkholderia megapolitana]SFJ08741.1 protease FtsH subunit HflC [Paraburkholderia megapolitana]
MNRIIALVVAIVVVLFVASSTVFVVDQRHMAVVSGRDGAAGTLAGPGLHVKLPAPLQNVTLIDTRIQSLDTPDEDNYVSADKTGLLVNPVIKYRVSDPLKLVAETKGDTQGLPDRLALLARSALGDAFAKYTVADALAKQQDIANEARDSMQKAAASLGVDVLAVQLTRIDFPAAMADSVYKRMIAARQQAASEERAKGASEADQIKADADRKQQALLADAYQQAQTIKGEGDGNAASIAADAFGRDPQFYEFYQSMLAYRNSFKPNDVIVVDPSSDFFRFMRSPSGAASPDAAAAPRKH